MKKISKADRIKYGGRILIGGIVCIAAAALLLAYNGIMDSRAGSFSREVMEQIKAPSNAGSTGETSDPSGSDGSGAPPADRSGTFVYKGYSFMGYLTIPALSLELPVMSDWDYDRLNVSPCRYAGSVISGDLVIAAHNYDSHFGQLYRLSPGDEVRYTDLRGNTYRYRVAVTDTLAPVQISEMTAGRYPLSLFTCNLGGTARVTVRCVRE